MVHPPPQPASLCGPCGFLYYTVVLDLKTGSTVLSVSYEFQCISYYILWTMYKYSLHGHMLFNQLKSIPVVCYVYNIFPASPCCQTDLYNREVTETFIWPSRVQELLLVWILWPVCEHDEVIADLLQLHTAAQHQMWRRIKKKLALIKSSLATVAKPSDVVTTWRRKVGQGL